jgi:hypothetical protein
VTDDTHERPEDSEEERESDYTPGQLVVVDGTRHVVDKRGVLVPEVLETPSHGHGQLRRGNPGHQGGGRKPDEVKRYFLELARKAQYEADKRLDPDEVENMSTQDLAKLLDVFGKYSVGTKHTMTGPDDGPLRHGIMVMPELDPPGGETSGDDS